MERRIMNKTMDQQRVQAILNDQGFQTLVRQKVRLGWTLAIIQLAIYFGFVLLVALSPDTLRQSLFGGVTTVGMPLGVAVILSAFVLSGIYVWYANSRFDQLTRRVVDEVQS
jgi:uncharacterized membrane protein (DUF485 family)